MMRALLIAAWIALLGVNSATARDVTDAEKAALADRVAAYQQAFIDKDYDAILDGSSPRFYQHVAAEAGATVPELRAFLIEQTRKVMASATIEAHEMNLANVAYLKTKYDTPYALIPTRVVLNVPDQGRFEIMRETLAIIDDGEWWLMRITNTGQVSTLQKVYPSLSNITFKPSETRRLD
ncbi:MAG: hypothetical protein AAFN51_09615 [Pseudomonadota bacterium]